MPALKLRGNKRPNYFTGQLLAQEDFLAEQRYHLDLERGHASTLHTPGVVMGLEVAGADAVSVVIRPGTALNAKGQLIVLETAQNLTLAPSTPDGAMYIVVSYDESMDDADRSGDNTQNFTRITELCVLSGQPAPPADDGNAITLSKVQFAAGKITGLDNTVRQLAGARLAPLSVGPVSLANGAVTLSKLAAELRGGWVRMPFKPSSFVDPKQVAGTADSVHDFTIGVTRTFCGERGAKGTMAIPMPVLADRIVSFFIAGETNDGGLKLELDLCGWDPGKMLHERIELVQTVIAPKTPFSQSFPISRSFDRNRHALAIYVEAAGRASISIVAAQFDSSLNDPTQASQ